MLVLFAASCVRTVRDGNTGTQNQGRPAPIESGLPFVPAPAYPVFPGEYRGNPAPGTRGDTIDPFAEAARLGHDSGYRFPLPTRAAGESPAALHPSP